MSIVNLGKAHIRQHFLAGFLEPELWRKQFRKNDEDWSFRHNYLHYGFERAIGDFMIFQSTPWVNGQFLLEGKRFPACRKNQLRVEFIDTVFWQRKKKQIAA